MPRMTPLSEMDPPVPPPPPPRPTLVYVPYLAPPPPPPPPPPAVEHDTTEAHAPKRPLPVARVRKIMKEHRDARFAEEAVTLMTVATELFVGKLTQLACESGPFEEPNTMGYPQLAKCIHSQTRMEFLHDFVPMTVRAGSLVAQAKDTLRNGENSNTS